MFTDDLNMLKVGGELYGDIICQPENERQIYVFCRYCVLLAINNFIDYTLDEIKNDIEFYMEDGTECTDSLINKCKSDGKKKIVDLFDCAVFQEKIKTEIEVLQPLYCSPEKIGETESVITARITDRYYEQLPSDLKKSSLLTKKQIKYIIEFDAFGIEDARSFLTSMENDPSPFTRDALINFKASHFERKIEKFTYLHKKLMTTNEKENYIHLLGAISPEYYLFPQISLMSVIEKRRLNYPAHNIGELSRIIDFGIFDKDFNVKMLIEINDKSHNEESRRLRDMHIRSILQKADIELITLKPLDYKTNGLITQKLGDLAKK